MKIPKERSQKRIAKICDRYDYYSINQFSNCSAGILIKWRVLLVTKISARERATAAMTASNTPVGLPIDFNSA